VAFFFAEVTGVLHPVPDEEMPAPPEEKGTVVAGVFCCWKKNPSWVVVSFFLINFQPYLGKIPILTNIFQMG